jgi:hypothetical protein
MKSGNNTLGFVIAFIAPFSYGWALAYDAQKVGFAAAEYIGSVYGMDALAGTDCGYLFKSRVDPNWAFSEVKKSLTPSDQLEIDRMAKGPQFKKVAADATRTILETRAVHTKQGLDLRSSCGMIYGAMFKFYNEKKVLWQEAIRR